ncbi:MAG: metalloregulator ArsR/SmtB family transcription factor [Candidatus Cloacimonadales bacterium]
MLDEFVLAKLSKLFNIISNPIRIKIIYALMESEDLTVTELSEKIDVTQNTLSAHLKILFDGAYLQKEQKWRKVYYSIKEPMLKDILEIGTHILYNKWEGNWEKIAAAKNVIEAKNKNQVEGE